MRGAKGAIDPGGSCATARIRQGRGGALGLAIISAFPFEKGGKKFTCA